MRIGLGTLCSLRGCHRTCIQFLCHRNCQRSRLFFIILLIQLIAGSWLVYRLKQPHKRVRSLIKHPYHLFNKGQFKQRPDERQCSPDSQEQEESIFAAVTETAVEQGRKELCTHCYLSKLGNNISFWRKRLIEHNVFQQTECDGSNNAPALLLLETDVSTLSESVHSVLTAFIAAILGKRVFIVASPVPIANEEVLVHRNLDWRPTSGCGQVIADEVPASAIRIVQPVCSSLILALNITTANHPPPSGLDLDCVEVLLRSTFGSTLTRSIAHAIASASFWSGFDLPLAARRTVKSFLRFARSKPKEKNLPATMAVAPTKEAARPETSDLSATLPPPTAAAAIATPFLLSSAESGLICVYMESDMVHTNNLWRCTRLMEQIVSFPRALYFDWVLVGRNQSLLQGMRKQAQQYLQCSSKAMHVNRTIHTWTASARGNAASEWMSDAYLLSQCSGHVGQSHSHVSRFASVLAGRQYMSVRPDAWKGHITKQLSDLCHLDHAM